MLLTFSGRIAYANGDPAPNVTVHIFDKDAAGREDDDLTVTPGLSDEKGFFSLSYEPLRYLDYHIINISGSQPRPGNTQSEVEDIRIPDLADAYLPHLKFNYTFNNLICTHTASLGVLQKQFHLPEYPPIEFIPSIHGFKFANAFSGYFLPFSPPAFMSTPKVSSKYGLCGGMCAAAYDFALAAKPIPTDTDVPRQGSRLQRYLFQRQMDSLGGLGQEVLKVAQWTSLPDLTPVGTLRRSADEFVSIRHKLDQKNPVILAIIYVHASSLRQLSKVIFNNHQVLAYAYQQDADGSYTLKVYDPNLPCSDDVVIHLKPVSLAEGPVSSGLQIATGVKSTQLLSGTHYRDVRGIFAMPYTPTRPPKGL
jgi:hypothetical protein